MKVQSVSIFSHGGAQYEVGDILDLASPDFDDFIKRGLVKKLRGPKPRGAAVKPPEPEVESSSHVETAAYEGAPEAALSRRGRRGRHRQNIYER